MILPFRTSIFWIALLGPIFDLAGQDTLHLFDAYALYASRYPVLKNSEIYQKIYQAEIQELDLGQKPQIFLKGEARLQTESTQLDAGDMPLPFAIDLPLASARSFAEARYQISDGGRLEAMKRSKAALHLVNQEKLVVQEASLRQHINRLFATVRGLRAQQQLADLSLENIKTRREVLAQAVEHGVTLPSELAKLTIKKKEIEANQKNLQAGMLAAVRTLSELIGKTIDTSVILILPELPPTKIIPKLDRAESAMYQARREAILARSDLIESSLKPQLFAFAQAGIGYPNPLNLLDNGVAPYGIIGASLSWQLTDWGKQNTQRELLTLQAEELRREEETLLFNLALEEQKYLTEMDRIEGQISTYREIAELQADILQQVSEQVDAQVTSVADYLLQLNAELAARQQVRLLEEKLLTTQLEFLDTRGVWDPALLLN